ncbi:H-NS family nucleoid-associated regulatory protein [Acidovorax sp. sic0104]|uniref:H-NS histone family protein n=1 Tax=Acidovorax sp. sic0104 TaxID=2854784 RepID=UPI001C489E7C|nr:H-NS histone family protein [Acidovorax sp. sic0104]MBV7542038.1 H-NS histone family protein [Acidovorax sp. sic0104]
MTQSQSLKDLVAQREALDSQIALLRKEETSGAIAKARELVAAFELTQEQVFPTGRKVSSAKGKTVAPKYRHPETGQTWTGRGKPPTWIRAEADRSKFAI